MKWPPTNELLQMITRLILLPADPAAPVTCLHVDAGGRVLERIHASTAAPLPPSASSIRTVLVVPGIQARALWLDLPARNPVQALAAATLLAADHIAGPRDALHIAIAPGAVGDPRLVVVVQREVIQAWLDRAAALGAMPDAVVPEHLMLPLIDAETITVVRIDDRWAVRGEQLAFSAEPELATRVIGERALTLIDDPQRVEAMFAAAASAPAIDLRQYAFAIEGARREGWPAYRRVAALLAALALSPLLLISAQALRYEMAARNLQARAQTIAQSVSPGYVDSDPLPAIDARLLELQTTDAFAAHAGALLGAIELTAGAQLDALSYSDAVLQARVVHAGAAELEAIRSAVAERGLQLEETATEPVEGGTASDIVLRPGA